MLELETVALAVPIASQPVLLAWTSLWENSKVVADAMKKDWRMMRACNENLDAGKMSFPQDRVEILSRGLVTNRNVCGRQVQREDRKDRLSAENRKGRQAAKGNGFTYDPEDLACEVVNGADFVRWR